MKSRYSAIAALICGAMAFSAPPATAGNSYGKDGNPGKANGQTESAAASSSNGKGNLSSAMGSLNAAHASANGLEHASPKSKVGMLAAYMDAMVVYETEYALVDWTAYDALIGEYDALQTDADALYTEYESLLAAEDPTAADKLAEYEAKQAEADAKLAEADALTAAVDAAAGDAAGDLEDAANKDGLIDADVVDAVNSLLDGKSEDFTHSDVVHESEEGIAGIINPE